MYVVFLYEMFEIYLLDIQSYTSDVESLLPKVRLDVRETLYQKT